MSAATPTFDIPGYRIVRPLGEGGMATVYLALQTALGRQVAIKVLAVQRAPSEELVRRFEQETRLIARLDHPHIVSIYEVGRTSTGQLYYTMPYLPNGDLAARDLREDQTGIVAVMRALCQALAYAHDQGIVHRDVKPENVLFDKLDRPLLADFGIALATHSDVRVTREGATLGSTGYMSPEQARGLAIDGRSDLYSLGVLCYELVAGELPFQGPDALAVALAHVENPVPRLSPTRRHWQALIDRALAKDPAERFQSAAELLEALDAVQAHLNGQAPSGAGAPAPRRQRWAWSRSHWLAAGAAGLLLVGAGQLLRGPAAERAGVRLAIHPDDPPWDILGLPRVVVDGPALLRLTASPRSPSNGVTFCTGSLGPEEGNDLPAMARSLASRIPFAHLRNVARTGTRDFHETAHASSAGSLDMWEIVRALHESGFDGVVRPDHGRMIWGEQGRPGYGLYDRALGAMYLAGLFEAAEKGAPPPA